MTSEATTPVGEWIEAPEGGWAKNPVGDATVEGCNVGGTVGTAPGQFHDWPNVARYRLVSAPAGVGKGEGDWLELKPNDIAEIIDQNADADISGLHNASQLAEKIYRAMKDRPTPSTASPADNALLSDCYLAMAAAMRIIDADAGPGRVHSEALQKLADCRVRIEERTAALAKLEGKS